MPRPDEPTGDWMSDAAPQPAAPPPRPGPPPESAPAPEVAGRAAPTGRRYGFLCAYCSSRLEATESLAGQHGTCPTCGKTITVPILDARGRLIDPESGQVIKQDPHPVHAYAAAGEKAPLIVPGAQPDERLIQCPRCGRTNSLVANNCAGCGLPFTMEGTMVDTISGTNTWAVASLVLGIVGIPGACLAGIPCILAIIFGAVALRGLGQASGTQGGRGMAITGIVLGCLGVALFVFLFSRMR